MDPGVTTMRALEINDPPKDESAGEPYRNDRNWHKTAVQAWQRGDDDEAQTAALIGIGLLLSDISWAIQESYRGKGL